MIYDIVRQCGAIAGLKKRVSPHTFRHSFATHLHQKGVDINRLALLLGHSNIEKTAIYTHTDDEELTQAVLKLKEDGAVWLIK
jgi:integrase/recombinase XerD